MYQVEWQEFKEFVDRELSSISYLPVGLKWILSTQKNGLTLQTILVESDDPVEYAEFEANYK